MLMRVRIPISIPSEDENKGAFGKFWSDITKPEDKRIEKIVLLHLPVLARKRMQLLVKNDYGKHDKKGWERELSYFISKVLIPEMPRWHSLRNEPPSVRQVTKAAQIVDRVVAEECTRLEQEVEFREVPNEGAAYESYCQKLLESNGWKVFDTRKTGDQGVDLVGSYGQCVVAFQCKRLNRPVGNGAVQEVVSGRKLYHAHLAAVISNSPYTRAANYLAQAHNVLLLHHSDLVQLHKNNHILER